MVAVFVCICVSVCVYVGRGWGGGEKGRERRGEKMEGERDYVRLCCVYVSLSVCVSACFCVFLH